MRTRSFFPGTFLLICSIFLSWQLAFSQSQETDQVIALKCGRIIDGKSNETKENVTVLVQGNKITSVGKDISIPVDAKVLDLGTATVLPGLIDTHTHLFLHEGDYDEQLLKWSQA
ncbi:MAG: hypothetical protein AABZ61_06125, partial [Bacteroidota bacterium]